MKRVYPWLYIYPGVFMHVLLAEYTSSTCSYDEASSSPRNLRKQRLSWQKPLSAHEDRSGGWKVCIVYY